MCKLVKKTLEKCVNFKKCVEFKDNYKNPRVRLLICTDVSIYRKGYTSEFFQQKKVNKEKGLFEYKLFCITNLNLPRNI